MHRSIYVPETITVIGGFPSSTSLYLKLPSPICACFQHQTVTRQFDRICFPLPDLLPLPVSDYWRGKHRDKQTCRLQRLGLTLSTPSLKIWQKYTAASYFWMSISSFIWGDLLGWKLLTYPFKTSQMCCHSIKIVSFIYVGHQCTALF